jgi:hypothetical protein
VTTAFASSDLQILLDLLFETYALYEDRESRRAVEELIKVLANTPYAPVALPVIVKFLKQESLKKNISLAASFSLVEWSSVLLQQCAKVPQQWNKIGLEVATADARLLEICMAAGDSRRATRIQHHALVVTRRALRSIFRSEQLGQEAASKLITTFTAKGSSPTAGNAVFLGVIAGVAARLAAVKPVIERQKQEYYTFYIREIVGSKSPLPNCISNALHDFFESFASIEELQKEVIPPIEKALLRAPEVVLNNIVSSMILALPKDLDLSTILHANLLKPLLSNVKSTNATIRAGALRTFQALASRSHDDALVGKVADEILNPLKQGKVTTADQKVLHAQMLAALESSVPLAQKIPSTIAGVALKEPNEPAAVAEVTTMTTHLTYGLANGVPLDKTISDAFTKGMADKRIPIRRLWAIRAADIWWHLSSEQHAQSDIQAFCQATLPKLVEMWQDVVTNPVPATQSGMVTVGHSVTVILLTKVRTLEDGKLTTIYKKTNAVSQSLAIQPKPSFLLNPRVYTKLSTEEDVDIALRAYSAVAPFLSEKTTPIEAREAWSQALIYFIVAQGVSPKAKKAARHALSKIYVTSPMEITSIIVQGLWAWYKAVEQGDKDSAAVAAKSGTDELSAVLGSICLSGETLKSLDATVPEETLRTQCIHLLILARSEIIPRTSWIDLCLKMGVDPGQLARDHLDECIQLAIDATVSLPTGTESAADNCMQGNVNSDYPAISQAAYNAFTDLAFVAPDVALPAVVKQFSVDLDPKQLDSIGPTEAAIFRTPEGTAYVDVLSKKAPQSIDKNTKDYDTLKWEEELRAQLAQKTGQTKKLTADEQAKVKAQLAKESAIRKEVSATAIKMKRGVGIIQSLALGPPTEAEQWMGPAVELLIKTIRAGVGLVLGDLPALAYIKCSERISARLGVLRPFVGAATLRTIGALHLSEEFEQENLGGMSIFCFGLT